MTLVRTIVTYGCETWTSSVRDVKSLFVFERQTLRETHGAFQTEEGWRIRNNGQMQKLIRGEDRVKSIRAHSGGDISTGWEKQNSEEGYRMEFHRSEMQRMAKR